MEHKSNTDCSADLIAVRDTLDVINGKWKIQIIITMSKGNKRFGEIERSIPKITSKVLSKELKDLEAHQLIKRTVYDSVPVSVEYTLLPYSMTLKKVIDSLRDWGIQHRKLIIGDKSGK